MAMIKCPECGNDISDKALACPKCGYPINVHVVNTEQNFVGNVNNVPQDVIMANQQIQNGQMIYQQMPNGQMMNGQMPNGQTMNGQMPNGQMMNGQMSNGQTMNGQMPNGQMMNGQMPNGQMLNDQMSNAQMQSNMTMTDSNPGGVFMNQGMPDNSREVKKKKELSPTITQLLCFFVFPIIFVAVGFAIDLFWIDIGIYILAILLVCLYALGAIVGFRAFNNRKAGEKSKAGNFVLSILAIFAIVGIITQINIRPQLRFAVNSYEACVDEFYAKRENLKVGTQSSNPFVQSEAILEVQSYCMACETAENAVDFLGTKTLMEKIYVKKMNDRLENKINAISSTFN